MNKLLLVQRHNLNDYNWRYVLNRWVP
jgi:hypothetical protein